MFEVEKQKFPTVRLFVTGLLIVAYAILGSIWSRAYSMYQSVIAAQQINDDSVGGNALAFFLRNNDLVGAIGFVAFVALVVWMWRRELKVLLSGLTSVFLVLVLGILLISGTACATRASTESEGTAQSDILDVQPNQTAFVIPVLGGNLSGQQKFDSIQYLEDKKVASKRITIDKDLVGGAYKPKIYVYLVDRAPVARQWTEDKGTGTTAANEALCGESSEGIQVCFQISMAASILEEDTATYLYYYPTSVLQGGKIGGVYVNTPLANVIDNQIRNYATSLLGTEAKSRPLVQIIKQTNDIVVSVESKAQQYFKKQGITIGYLGMGGQISLDPEVQAIINKMFIAQQDQEIAKVKATTVAIDATAQKQALMLKGDGDAYAMQKLVEAWGSKDLSALPGAIESYRWDGSRLTVTLAPNTNVAVAVPQPSPAPVIQPVKGITATPGK